MKTIIYNYDDFLVTPKNIAVFRSKLAAVGTVLNSFVQYPNRLEFELSGIVTQDTVSWCADFWEGTLFGTPEPNYKAVALELFTMLDDIDTMSDVFKDNHTAYRKAVSSILKRKDAFCKSNGYTVTFTTPQPKYCEGGCTCH